jgi:hypothetical protein
VPLRGASHQLSVAQLTGLPLFRLLQAAQQTHAARTALRTGAMLAAAVATLLALNTVLWVLPLHVGRQGLSALLGDGAGALHDVYAYALGLHLVWCVYLGGR